MPRNVEVKARVADPEALERRVASVAGGEPLRVEQEDVFFRVPRGRLKLRLLEDRAELIHYERPDAAGPKRSEYQIYAAPRPRELQAALAAALGVRGSVRKRRTVYHAGQTRIHLDQVDGLGSFAELEVVLRDDQRPEEGARIATELMASLGIAAGDLVEGAYIDLLDAGSTGPGRKREVATPGRVHGGPLPGTCRDEARLPRRSRRGRA